METRYGVFIKSPRNPIVSMLLCCDDKQDAIRQRDNLRRDNADTDTRFFVSTVVDDGE